MINGLFKVYFYLEEHIGWKIKVNFFASNKHNEEEFFLKSIVPNEYIEVTSNDKTYKFYFFSEDNYIESIYMSCQEGFYILIYEKDNNQNNDDSYYEYRKNKLEEFKKYDSLFDKENDMFSKKSKVYLFSNEPMLLNYINFKDKKILSIIGSGDFFFNTCLLGSTNIDLIDINEYAYYYYEIKKAIIKKYKYDEFISLYKEPKNVIEKFDEYKEYLSKDIKEKIINIFGKYINNSYEFIQNVFYSDSYLFNNDYNINNRIEFIKNNNYYLSDEKKYNELREILLNKKINCEIYMNSIFDFNFKNKYDYIYLSNVGDYYTDFDNLIYKIFKYNKDSRIILIYRTNNYKSILNDKDFKVEIVHINNKTSLNNTILIVSANKKAYIK